MHLKLKVLRFPVLMKKENFLNSSQDYQVALPVQLNSKSSSNDNKTYGKISRFWRQGHYRMVSTTDKVRQRVGSIVMTEEGGIVSSAGELENNESVAAIFYQMVKGADKAILSLSDKEEGFKKLSVNYEDFSYVVAISNKKIHISKIVATDPTFT